jgi:toxin ParE1/3/4
VRKLEYAPLADRDLLDIWAYTAKRWSEQQADTYLDRIYDVLDDVAAGRLQGLSADEVRPGYRLCRAGSHVAYFVEGSDTVTVIRVLHQSMDPDRQL